MYDRQLLARLYRSRSQYGMQHGSERRLFGRLLGPATMNIDAQVDHVRRARGCHTRGEYHEIAPGRRCYHEDDGRGRWHRMNGCVPRCGQVTIAR